MIRFENAQKFRNGIFFSPNHNPSYFLKDFCSSVDGLSETGANASVNVSTVQRGRANCGSAPAADRTVHRSPWQRGVNSSLFTGASQQS
jgi:hypothetical protein